MAMGRENRLLMIRNQELVEEVLVMTETLQASSACPAPPAQCGPLLRQWRRP